MYITYNWVWGGLLCTHPPTSAFYSFGVIPQTPSMKDYLSPLLDPLSGEALPFIPDHCWAEIAPSMPALGKGAFYLRPTTQ